MKKFVAVFIVLAFIVATFAGCGSSIKVTDLGFAKIVQYKDKDAIGPNNSGVAIFATPQQGVTQQQIVTTPPSIMTARCDARTIYAQIEKIRAEIARCKTFSLNNLKLRLKLGKLFLDLFACTCDHECIPEAIKNFEIAARNYRFGKDIKSHKAEADRLMAQVHESWTRAKQINVTVCSSVVTVPQSVVMAPQQPQFVYGSTGYGAGILESILPSALIAGGMVGAASALRPSETNVTATGTGGGGANVRTSTSTATSQTQAQNQDQAQAQGINP